MLGLTWTDTGLDDLEWWAKHEPARPRAARSCGPGGLPCLNCTTSVGAERL